jgi:hypothetical protein
MALDALRPAFTGALIRDVLAADARIHHLLAEPKRQKKRKHPPPEPLS